MHEIVKLGSACAGDSGGTRVFTNDLQQCGCSLLWLELLGLGSEDSREAQLKTEF